MLVVIVIVIVIDRGSNQSIGVLISPSGSSLSNPLSNPLSANGSVLPLSAMYPRVLE